MTSKLHKLLRPFLLRRLKADVEKGLPAKTEVNMYIPMSKMQKLLYGQILKKDVDAINGKVYCYMCVYMCPRTSIYIYVLVLVYLYVSSYSHQRQGILLYVSSY